MQQAPVKLRPHQIEAVEAIMQGLDIPPGKRIPARGLRATVVAACGTGKTMIAAHSALKLAPGGRVMVLLPTLDLLAQTVLEWRRAGHSGPMVAVCSMNDSPELWQAGVRSTTSVPQISLWHGTGPVTVFATYASLPVIAESHEGVFGMSFDPWDLVVIDEAHRTSGSLGKAWADIHDQTVIPAVRRLYMTATPRIWQERPPSWEVRERARDPLPAELAASMDDERIFGPVVYQLSMAQAVSLGLLARYQIIVVELVDPVVTPARLAGEEKREEKVRGERLGALQAAMLETAATHGLQTMITFHHRTVEAAAFAEGIPGMAKKLHKANPDRYPKTVWANWLSGEHDGELRREVLADFGARAGRAILSNCRVLGEGIDIRAVDSVALLDPKGSPVDIVQAIGRALRQKPDQGKVASLIVPVFLAPGEKPEDMMTSASYKPLVKVLEGLRAHDEKAVERLAIPQTNTSSWNSSERLGPPPAEGEEDTRPLLRFSTNRDPVMVAHWVRYNVIDTDRQDWNRGHYAARRFHEREGHLLVPYGHVEEAGEFPLGRWLSDQRRTYRAGNMSSKRAEQLEELGIVWDPADAEFAENLAAAQAYFEQAGTLCAPRGAVALGRPVGQWLTNVRRPGGLGKDPQRAATRQAQLAAIDSNWRPAWPADWQRLYAALRECLLDGGATLEEILPGVTVRGEDVGRWLRRQCNDWGRLSDEQRERLAQLGVTPSPTAQAAAQAAAAGTGKATAPATRNGASDAFTRGLVALRQYIGREGTTTVSRKHVERLEDGTQVRLGVWLSNTRSRRDKLTPDRLAQLVELGVL